MGLQVSTSTQTTTKGVSTELDDELIRIESDLRSNFNFPDAVQRLQHYIDEGNNHSNNNSVIYATWLLGIVYYIQSTKMTSSHALRTQQAEDTMTLFFDKVDNVQQHQHVVCFADECQVAALLLILSLPSSCNNNNESEKRQRWLSLRRFVRVNELSDSVLASWNSVVVGQICATEASLLRGLIYGFKTRCALRVEHQEMVARCNISDIEEVLSRRSVLKGFVESEESMLRHVQYEAASLAFIALEFLPLMLDDLQSTLFHLTIVVPCALQKQQVSLLSEECNRRSIAIARPELLSRSEVSRKFITAEAQIVFTTEIEELFYSGLEMCTLIENEMESRSEDVAYLENVQRNELIFSSKREALQLSESTRRETMARESLLLWNCLMQIHLTEGRDVIVSGEDESRGMLVLSESTVWLEQIEFAHSLLRNIHDAERIDFYFNIFFSFELYLREAIEREEMQFVAETLWFEALLFPIVELTSRADTLQQRERRKFVLVMRSETNERGMIGSDEEEQRQEVNRQFCAQKTDAVFAPLFLEVDSMYTTLILQHDVELVQDFFLPFALRCVHLEVCLEEDKVWEILMDKHSDDLAEIAAFVRSMASNVERLWNKEISYARFAVEMDELCAVEQLFREKHFSWLLLQQSSNELLDLSTRFHKHILYYTHFHPLEQDESIFRVDVELEEEEEFQQLVDRFVAAFDRFGALELLRSLQDSELAVRMNNIGIENVEFKAIVRSFFEQHFDSLETKERNHRIEITVLAFEGIQNIIREEGEEKGREEEEEVVHQFVPTRPPQMAQRAPARSNGNSSGGGRSASITTTTTTISARDSYARLCHKQNVSPNVQIEQQLQQQGDDDDNNSYGNDTPFEKVTHLTFENVYIGVKQLLPLFSLISSMPNLQVLVLDGMKLNDEHVNILVKQFEQVVGLQVLSLQHNPQITAIGGKHLFRLTATVRSLRSVKLEGTNVMESQRKKIQAEIDSR
eukprot:PhM_4_TR13968/c1_g1_i2/m.91844